MDTVNGFNNIIATSEWSIITENKKYIDLTLGLSCFTWGYNNKQLLQALKRGIDCGINFTRSDHNKYCNIIKKANALILSNTKMNEVIWTVSGTDAIEAAIHVSSQYHKKTDKKLDILSLSGYYGCSWLNKALNGEKITNHICNVSLPKWQTEADRELEENKTFNQIIEKIKSNNQIGTIVLESTPFSRGIRPWSEWWWEKIRQLQVQKNIIIILDDITGGFGKIAPYASHSRFNFNPDIITLSKGITGGYAPLSCALVGSTICSVLRTDTTTWSHGHTFQPYIPGLFVLEEIIKMTSINNFEEKESIFTAFLDKFVAAGKIKYYRGMGLAREIELNREINHDYLQTLGLVAIQKGSNSFLMIAPQNASPVYWDDVESKFSMFA